MPLQKLTYTVPDNPADPEAAALDLIVRIPADICAALDIKDPSAALARVEGDDKMVLRRSDTPGSSRGIWEAFAALLSAEGCFAEMSWHDAKHAATAIIFDATNRDNPVEFLRHRAHLTASGADNSHWDDRDAMVRAFTTAATVLGL